MDAHASPERQDAPSCWDTGYWLRRCEGFRLFVGDEPIGYVEDVAFGVDGEPAALAVCVGEDGARCTVDIGLLPDATVGESLLVHAGAALARLPEDPPARH